MSNTTYISVTSNGDQHDILMEIETFIISLIGIVSALLVAIISIATYMRRNLHKLLGEIRNPTTDEGIQDTLNLEIGEVDL